MQINDKRSEAQGKSSERCLLCRALTHYPIDPAHSSRRSPLANLKRDADPHGQTGASRMFVRAATTHRHITPGELNHPIVLNVPPAFGCGCFTPRLNSVTGLLAGIFPHLEILQP